MKVRGYHRCNFSSPAGTYYIRPGDAFSDKYSFTYVDGELILDSLTNQSTWDQNFSNAELDRLSI